MGGTYTARFVTRKKDRVNINTESQTLKEPQYPKEISLNLIDNILYIWVGNFRHAAKIEFACLRVWTPHTLDQRGQAFLDVVLAMGSERCISRTQIFTAHVSLSFCLEGPVSTIVRQSWQRKLFFFLLCPKLHYVR